MSKHLIPIKSCLSAALLPLLFCFLSSAYAQIRIGQTAGFTGQVGVGVTETWNGAKLYIDEINAKGGVNGQKIDIIQKDDQFKPELAAENAKSLIKKDKVIALFLNRGTPHTEAIMPLLEQYKIPLIAPSTGAMVLQKPLKPFIYNVRSTYQFEAAQTIEQLAAMSLKKIAVIHVDDSFGKDALEGYANGFKDAKVTPVFISKYDRSKPNFDAIVALTKKLEPNAIVFAGSGTSVAEGLTALRLAGWQGMVSTLSNNASEGFIKQLGANAAGTMVSQVFPNERLSSDPLIRELTLLNAAKNPNTPISPAMVEGFAAAKVLVQGLRAAGANPTREKLQRAMNTLKVDLGSLKIAYSDNNRAGVSFSELSIIGADSKFRR